MIDILSKDVSHFWVLRCKETNKWFFTKWIQEFQGGYEVPVLTETFSYLLSEGSNCVFYNTELAIGMLEHYQGKFGLSLELIPVIKEITCKIQPEGWF